MLKTRKICLLNLACFNKQYSFETIYMYLLCDLYKPKDRLICLFIRWEGTFNFIGQYVIIRSNLCIENSANVMITWILVLFWNFETFSWHQTQHGTISLSCPHTFAVSHGMTHRYIPYNYVTHMGKVRCTVWCKLPIMDISITYGYFQIGGYCPFNYRLE